MNIIINVTKLIDTIIVVSPEADVKAIEEKVKDALKRAIDSARLESLSPENLEYCAGK